MEIFKCTLSKVEILGVLHNLYIQTLCENKMGQITRANSSNHAKYRTRTSQRTPPFLFSYVVVQNVGWGCSAYKEPYFKEILIEIANFAISYCLTYIYSIYCAVGMLLHINGKFTKGKLQSSHLLSFVLNRRSLSISRWFNSDVDPEKC